ncbi:PREDICTED: uncharacterized protein LOC108555341 [Eufriesea mexicana]|uniref:uncharacterized protein LOC108555341 n=1 Tax=Eufriesea mexicana TaxID=516756 RepID=UPI00083C7939|nr:PREDICTED: uncharacterized protein LOC108555341 [Eufriesea mexicana]
MSGSSRKILVLLQVLCQLVVCIASMDDDEPIVYSIPLKNWTTIPDEYRNLSAVGKCCSVGEVLVYREFQGGVCTSENVSIAENFSPSFHFANASGYDHYGYHHDRFVAIVGNPCKYGR